ncbi:MAG: AMP-binding protein [Azoarcus sp.]|jgi:acyl-CoA synthetase (AMP-forming)/AMP-acid ligase II|nr:AMP-binding protein [Azoarcus sp.]
MSLKSPFPDASLPDAKLYDLIFGSLEPNERSRVAIMDGSTGQSLTYGELDRQILALAGALAARGLGAGTVIGLISPNTPAFATAFHGILRAGATVTPLNALFTEQDIAKQLKNAGARALFTHSSGLPKAWEAAAEVGIPKERVFVLDGVLDGAPDEFPSLAGLVAEERRAPEVHADPATHVAVLPYSSGTTGHPKGVMLSHRNFIANLASNQPLMRLSAAERVLAVLPFSHIFGMTALLNLSLLHRAQVVTMPRFTLPDFLRVVAEYRCTYLFIAPPLAVTLAKHPLVEEFNLTSIKMIYCGSAPLDHDIAMTTARRLNCRIRNAYGMTELTATTHMIAFDDDETRLNTVGMSVPNLEIKIVDAETGQEVAYPAPGSNETSAPGELWCRGPNVMMGYLDNPEATRAALDEEGFLHTGDVATVDGRGVLTIVDRIKELIKYHGYQVSPTELESVLLANPRIADAAVIGVADADGQEIPKAFIVKQHDAETLTAQEVMDFVAARVAPQKKIRAVSFVDLIPKTPSGKILRKDLKLLETTLELREAA